MISLLSPFPFYTNGPIQFRNHNWVSLGRKFRRRPPPPPAKLTECLRKVTTTSLRSSPVEVNAAAAVAVAVAVDDESTSQSSLYFEECIEQVIYRCRFLTMFAVVGSLMGSILCFVKGCWFMKNCFAEYAGSGGKVILVMVEAIDVYLIGTVMLIFGMGLYELFISNLDIVKTTSCGSNLLGLFELTERPQWLEIQSVNELKTKLGHVIVMVLLIGLFEKSKKVTISSSTDLLCFAVSILLASGSLYLLSMLRSSKNGKR